MAFNHINNMRRYSLHKLWLNWLKAYENLHQIVLKKYADTFQSKPDNVLETQTIQM